MSFEFAITVFAAIFAIVNPIGNIPVFIADHPGLHARSRSDG